jgi:hypothetical protein
MYSDGRDVLLWTGEIFCSPEDQNTSSSTTGHRRSISMALLSRLQSRGIDALRSAEGAFCGAWYDHRRDLWHVFNDRQGLLPVFWSASEDGLVVANRAWLTWSATDQPLEINPDGVAGLLRTQNMIEEDTLIAGVQWLKRGHVLAWGQEGCTTQRYWDMSYHAGAVTLEDAIDDCHEVMRKLHARHAASNAPLLMGISGGVDSRLMLAVCHELGYVPHCLSHGWHFSEDVRFGRSLARAAGATHEWAPLTDDRLPQQLAEAIVETDGLHSAAHLGPGSSLAAALAHHAGGILMEGFQHGAVGGALLPPEEDLSADRPPHASAWARGFLHAGGPFDVIDGLLQPDLARDSRARWQMHVDTTFRDTPSANAAECAEYTIMSGRSGRNDVLGTAQLRRDVLVRSPACDQALFDWMARTPVELRRGRLVFIELLRRRYPRFARVPRSDGCGGLPIATHRWLREYHWQREKLYRRWIGWRHHWPDGWGLTGPAVRAWTFETWRRSGALEVLLCASARVLEYVRREALLDLWSATVREPLTANTILGLATAEFMIRWLQELPAARSPARGENVRFQQIGSDPGVHHCSVRSVGAKEASVVSSHC